MAANPCLDAQSVRLVHQARQPCCRLFRLSPPRVAPADDGVPEDLGCCLPACPVLQLRKCDLTLGIGIRVNAGRAKLSAAPKPPSWRHCKISSARRSSTAKP